jgi:hypothetical protein
MYLPSKSGLARKTITDFSPELIAPLKCHARSYAKFLHPIPGGPDDFNYPLMNNSLTLESVLNLLEGKPKSCQEIEYAAGLSDFDNYEFVEKPPDEPRFSFR